MWCWRLPKVRKLFSEPDRLRRRRRTPMPSVLVPPGLIDDPGPWLRNLGRTPNQRGPDGELCWPISLLRVWAPVCLQLVRANGRIHHGRSRLLSRKGRFRNYLHVRNASINRPRRPTRRRTPVMRLWQRLRRQRQCQPPARLSPSSLRLRPRRRPLMPRQLTRHRINQEGWSGWTSRR